MLSCDQMIQRDPPEHIRQGIQKRNDQCEYPEQCAAFFCLLQRLLYSSVTGLRLQLLNGAICRLRLGLCDLSSAHAAKYGVIRKLCSAKRTIHVFFLLFLR